jgi:hypothetical protein
MRERMLLNRRPGTRPGTRSKSRELQENEKYSSQIAEGRADSMDAGSVERARGGDHSTMSGGMHMREKQIISTKT